jgi:hypothetical protein
MFFNIIVENWRVNWGTRPATANTTSRLTSENKTSRSSYWQARTCSLWLQANSCGLELQNGSLLGQPAQLYASGPLQCKSATHRLRIQASTHWIILQLTPERGQYLQPPAWLLQDTNSRPTQFQANSWGPKP